jgi:putative exosortase-associated protein (TIGR04073 family)
MRQIVIAVSTLCLILTMTCLSFAFETDFDDLYRFDRSLPSWKLGRGIVNMVGAPQELFSTMTNSAIKGNFNGAYEEGFYGSWAGALNGYIAGIIPGVTRTIQRFTTGMMEVATFWKPEYGPTMEPVHGTRCRAFGESDYFSSDPFWYWGPLRN